MIWGCVKYAEGIGKIEKIGKADYIVYVLQVVLLRYFQMYLQSNQYRGKGGIYLSKQELQCRLCQQFFNNEDMSEEHYPAHSVGNDDIIALDFIKFMDTIRGNNPELKEVISSAMHNGKDPKECADKYFDKHLAKDLYPKGRTARTLCRKCNTFLGKYDEAYKKFYLEDGNPKKIKGFQEQTKIQIVKAIYAKFLSLPETQDIHFDFLDFIRDPEAMEYYGDWRLYFIKRDYSTDLIGLSDISTGKIDWNEDGKMLVFELSDDKFIFNLCNFEKFPEFEMNNIFDIMKKSYSLVTGIYGNKGSFHENLVMSHMFEGIDI